MEQDQEEITKTDKNQINSKQNKPKLKAKQPVKTMKKKIFVKKKEMLSNKSVHESLYERSGHNEVNLYHSLRLQRKKLYPVCKGSWK